MAARKRIGEQNPSQLVVCSYSRSEGPKALKEYRESGRKPQPWQELLTTDILATKQKLWVHTKAGYSIPRRNGKGEILTIVENHFLRMGLKVLHTAHRTTTSSSAAYRLAKLLTDAGYQEITRPKKGQTYSKAFIFAKQFGLEKITFLDTGATIDFRTRTSKGGLGEGFDILIIDEAQEYTEDQQSSLQYVVSDSANPMIILCGTPPTAVSSGTVFPKLRDACISGETEETYWAEWSVEKQSDCNDVELWYKCNPAMGFQLNERKIKAEDKTDEIDFNIQRLGLWLRYNQKSAISEGEWKNLAVETVPKRKSQKCIGIKYGQDGVNVAMSIAYKTVEGKIFVETIACNPTRAGNSWIIEFLKKAKDIGTVVVDGANGQQLLADEMKKEKLKDPILPKVKEVITANASFELAVFNDGLCHRAQPSLVQVVTNCDKRTIGSNGGFGYKSIKPDAEIALMDSVILAHWAATELKEPKKQKVSY